MIYNVNNKKSYYLVQKKSFYVIQDVKQKSTQKWITSGMLWLCEMKNGFWVYLMQC
jgi:hypothetical protein